MRRCTEPDHSSTPPSRPLPPPHHLVPSSMIPSPIVAESPQGSTSGWWSQPLGEFVVVQHPLLLTRALVQRLLPPPLWLDLPGLALLALHILAYPTPIQITLRRHRLQHRHRGSALACTLRSPCPLAQHRAPRQTAPRLNNVGRLSLDQLAPVVRAPLLLPVRTREIPLHASAASVGSDPAAEPPRLSHGRSRRIRSFG